MSVYKIINPETLGVPRGWNNGMLAPVGGRLLFVAGQIASNRDGDIVCDDFVGQFSQTLANVLSVVEAAGGNARSIGRLLVFVTDMDAYLGSLSELGNAYRSAMGKHFPAMALVAVSRLVHPSALVEIEAMAVI